jgi:hypothetical protein
MLLLEYMARGFHIYKQQIGNPKYLTFLTIGQPTDTRKKDLQRFMLCKSLILRLPLQYNFDALRNAWVTEQHNASFRIMMKRSFRSANGYSMWFG